MRSETLNYQSFNGLCPLEYGSVVYEAWGLLSIMGIDLEDITVENNCDLDLRNDKGNKEKLTNILYPNPTTGLVHLSIDKDIADELFIFNIVGERIISKKLNTNEVNFVIDMSGFENGMYIYKLKKADSEVLSGKLILLK